jgi:hypothetical protein
MSMPDPNEKKVGAEEDHIVFNGFNLLVFDYFKDKLADLEGYAGFTPRWTLHSKLRNTTNHNLNTSTLLLAIVSLSLCIIII